MTRSDRKKWVGASGSLACLCIVSLLFGNTAEAQGRMFIWGATRSSSAFASPTPIPIPGLTGVIAVAAGDDRNFAVKSDGTVWAWGKNWNGELGDGTTIDRQTPVPISGLTNVIAVSSGGYHTLALLSDGTVRAWGSNYRGQLGDGTTTGHITPAPVNGLTDVIAVSAGVLHSLALKSDGSVWWWGWDARGQTGDQTPSTPRYSPEPVPGPNGVGTLTGVVAISAGYEHSLVVKADGTVWAWGLNRRGKLGDGTTTHRLTPVQAVRLTNMVAVSASYHHSLGLKADGTAWAWGDNPEGQLGNGTRLLSIWPAPVHGPDDVGVLTGMTAISAGLWHSLALKSDGTVWSWGRRYEGQLGIGYTATDHFTPVQAHDLTNAVAVSAGYYHSVALNGWRLLLHNTTNGDVSYRLMDGLRLHSTGAIAPAVPTDWHIVGTLDLNADGQDDLLWHNTQTGDVAYWQMNGTTPASVYGYVQRNVPLVWRPAAVADLNNDGKKNILWQNSANGDIAYWLMEGTTVSATGYLARAVPTEWQLTAALDLNGDNKPDLLWRNTATGDLAYWRMNGFTQTSYGYLQRNFPLKWRLAATVDLDDDGNTDLIWQNTGTGDVIYWKLNGITILSAGILAREIPATLQIRGAF